MPPKNSNYDTEDRLRPDLNEHEYRIVAITVADKEGTAGVVRVVTVKAMRQLEDLL